MLPTVLQLELPLLSTASQLLRYQTSGTFLDNMKLPVHRWFRFSAGFSAEWVEAVIRKAREELGDVTVLDPFAGAGTTLLASEKVGVSCYGIEAHPFIVRVARAKLFYNSDPTAYLEYVNEIRSCAEQLQGRVDSYPALIRKCFSDESLSCLDSLRQAWERFDDGSPQSQLAWLTLVAILRAVSHVGTAPWQYVLPNKNKKKFLEPMLAFDLMAKVIATDMALVGSMKISKATLIQSDARTCEGIPKNFANLVIASPPYANNYDYADATRLEMCFMGEVNGWGDLQTVVRQHLIRACSQHVTDRVVNLDQVLSAPELEPIKDRLTQVCLELAQVRHQHGGRKNYHLMVACYFLDIAQVWRSLRQVCKYPSSVCFVIGDSAPYGVYVPVMQWTGELAVAAGFDTFEFEKIRDRNVKWRNRKHQVPLCEGHLWITDRLQDNISSTLDSTDQKNMSDNVDDFESTDSSSSGHKLGQLIGDWWEQYIVLPMVEKVALKLELFLDSRFTKRLCRGDKIVWKDVDGDSVSYDFVLELNGSNTNMGIPVCFIESFWRRGSRHSRDKAKDDIGKLSPMRNSFPTARFIGIVAGGDFTKPAIRFIQGREVNLFYIPKANIISAFSQEGLIMDYPDKAKEVEKAKITTTFEGAFSVEKKIKVANNLINIAGQATFEAYIARVKSSLAALPQEVRFIESFHSAPVGFGNLYDATTFLESPFFDRANQNTTYRYEVTYSDGTEFVREVENLTRLRKLHSQLVELSKHMESLLNKNL